ncbi:uncharacterized protein [Gossypium hirsutum]|uniref:Uncharacterized protein n=1 Tax=Gossypium hirsutum TaxID=3635 RepID=A0ABM3BZN5_GOSHI|nr:uncharacterized protein LOC121231813 [Gossypium hirsutum]
MISTPSRKDTEKFEVVLAGLPPELDVVLTLASFSTETLPFQRMVDVLLEYETRLTRAVQELPLQANLVESDPSLTMVAPSHGGRSSSGGRGKGFCNRIQCQIYGRFGHLTQRCYYRFGRDYGGDSAPNTAPVMVPSGDDGHGSRNAPGGEQGWWAARSARGGSTVLGVHR